MIDIFETRDIAACRALRRAVFTEEQGVSEAVEVDDKDDEAIHLLATVDGRPVGSARLLVLDEVGKIGRVCVLAQARGTGLGVALMQAAVDRFRSVAGVKQVKLGAQVHALGFYERLGFCAVGEVFDAAGIPHREMVLSLQAPIAVVFGANTADHRPWRRIFAGMKGQAVASDRGPC